MPFQNPDNPHNLRAVGFSLASFALFATHDAVIKFLGETYAPFQIIFFSSLLGFPLAMVWLMRDRSAATLIPVHPWWLTLRVVMGVVTAACAFYAFSVLPLAQVYVFLFASPFLITILSIPILGERVGAHRWTAVALGFLGVIVALRPGNADLGLGHLAGITAAVTSAFASIITRRIGKEERSHVMVLYPMTANVLVMGALLPFVYKPMPVEHLGLLALMAVLGFTALNLIVAAYRTGEAAIVAPMQYSQIFWGASYGALLFGDWPDGWTWAGVAIIIASGLYVVFREATAGTSREAPVSTTKARPDAAPAMRIAASIRRAGDRVEPGHVALAKARNTK